MPSLLRPMLPLVGGFAISSDGFFFPRDDLDEILDLIESVSQGFPTYSYGVPGNLKSHSCQ